MISPLLVACPFLNVPSTDPLEHPYGSFSLCNCMLPSCITPPSSGMTVLETSLVLFFGVFFFFCFILYKFFSTPHLFRIGLTSPGVFLLS